MNRFQIPIFDSTQQIVYRELCFTEGMKSIEIVLRAVHPLRLDDVIHYHQLLSAITNCLHNTVHHRSRSSNTDFSKMKNITLPILCIKFTIGVMRNSFKARASNSWK